MAAEISGLPAIACKPRNAASPATDRRERRPERARAAIKGRYMKAPKWFQYADREAANPLPTKSAAQAKQAGVDAPSSRRNRQAPHAPTAK